MFYYFTPLFSIIPIVAMVDYKLRLINTSFANTRIDHTFVK